MQNVAKRNKKEKRKFIGGGKSFDNRKKRTVAKMLQLENDSGERKSKISPVFPSLLNTEERKSEISPVYPSFLHI